MRLLLALFAISLSVISALPVALVPPVAVPASLMEEDSEELERCDPDPCPADNVEEAPSMEDSTEIVLDQEDVVEFSDLEANLEANRTEAEHEVAEYYHKWSGWVNKWDKRVSYGAKWKTVAINAVYSIHKNYYEDRRFQYKSKTYARGMLTRVQWWTKYTAWQKTFTVYRTNAVMVGVQSFHLNSKEDRRFRFLFRKINLKVWRKKTWRWTKANKYDGKQNSNCGSGWVMGLYSTYSKKHKDRSFKVLCGWIIRRPTTSKATWVTRTRAVAKSTTVTNSVSVTRKK